MKKALLTTMLMLFILVASVFCYDVPTDSNVSLGFKIYRQNTNNRQDELLLYFFKIDSSEWNQNYNAGDLSLDQGHVISDFTIDTTKGLNTPQVIVAFDTRYVYNFDFWLKFSKMTAPGSLYEGKYTVRIYSRYYYKNFNAKTAGSDSLNYPLSSRGVTYTDYSFDKVENGETVSSEKIEAKIHFPEMSSLGIDDNGRERWMYVIAFDFAGVTPNANCIDYLSDYPGNDYSATIKVEVNSI